MSGRTPGQGQGNGLVDYTLHHQLPIQQQQPSPPRQQHQQQYHSNQQQHQQYHQGPVSKTSYDDLRYPTSPSQAYPQQQQQHPSPSHHHTDTTNLLRQPTQPSQQQLQQLQLQKQHQQRLQEQILAQDTLRLQQQQGGRVPRVQQQQTPSNAQRNPTATAGEVKPPSYYSYPPQPSPSSDSPEQAGEGGDLTWSARLAGLVRFPCSTYGKAFLGTIGMEALLVIIMQAIIVIFYFQYLRPATAEDTLPPSLALNNESRSVPAYLIVFVFAQLFQLVVAWDAVRAQNTIELVGIVIFNLCCFAYSIFEISQMESALISSQREGYFNLPGKTADEFLTLVRPFLIVVVVVIGITQCLITWLSYQLFQEFGWKIYKKIGADPDMKRMYRAYQIFLVLIKMDLFFFVGFSIQFIYLTLVRRGQDPEFWLTILVLPITIVILFVALYAVRHESRKGMATFITFMLAGVAYFIFKVVRMYWGNKVDQFMGVKQFLTLFAALCLITILATIANASICYRNFKKGLKPHIMRDARQVQNSAASPGGRVMEID